MWRRRVAAILVLSCTALSLTGCWDRKELEEAAFVLAIGVDEGKENTYSVTFMIALPAKMAGGGGEGGGGGGEGKPYMLTTVEAPTVTGALSIINTAVDRRVTLTHTRVLLMGEDLAKVSGLRTMDEFTRFREARRTVMYIVTKGRAADFLDGLKPEMEKDPGRFIDTMANSSRYTGMLPNASQIHNFVTAVNTGYSSPITFYAALKQAKEGGEEKGAGGGKNRKESTFKAGEIPRKGGPNLEMIGAAAFRRDQMVGVLTGEEVRLVLMLQDQFRHGIFSLPDPRRTDLFISLDVERGRPTSIAVDLTGGQPRLRALVTLEAEILAIQSDIDYTDPRIQVELENALAREIEHRMSDLIRRTKEWEADLAGFGHHVVQKFATMAEWEAYDWPRRYRDAEVTVNVKVSLRRFGLQLSPHLSAEERS